MNLILFSDQDRWDANCILLTGRRLEHIKKVLKLQSGAICKLGEINGQIGSGKLLAIDDDKAILEYTPQSDPPLPLALKCAIALPRPKTFRKVLHVAVSFGVKELHFFQSAKVDKSYWQSPFLADEYIAEQIHLALEQASDTVMPQINFHRLFRPFVEDVLPKIATGAQLLIAHPDLESTPYPAKYTQKACLVLGPEGGFTPFEIELTKKSGGGVYTLGPRILRTEFALAAALSRHIP